MTDPGVDVRPLRQITGEAEFNEVWLTGVRIPDGYRLGPVGAGWKVAQATLMNERIAIGGAASPRESGMIGVSARLWRDRPDLRRPELHDRLLPLWVDAEVNRITGQRLRQQLAAGQPVRRGRRTSSRSRGSHRRSAGWRSSCGARRAWRTTTGRASGPTVDFTGETTGRGVGYRYLRAKGNSIEGGTSEILRNVVAERVLGLPADPRTDTRPRKDLPR